MTRLTQRIKHKENHRHGVYVENQDYISAANKLADYEDAEEQGRLAMLPVAADELPCYALRISGNRAEIVKATAKQFLVLLERGSEQMIMDPANVFYDREKAFAALEKVRAELKQ